MTPKQLYVTHLKTSRRRDEPPEPTSDLPKQQYRTHLKTARRRVRFWSA